MSGWTAWRFAHPVFLTLVVLLMPVVWAGLRGQGQARLRLSTVALVDAAGRGRGGLVRRVPLALRVAAIFLGIVALARPQGGAVSREVLSEGVDIVLAADTSGSMRAMDFTIDESRVDRLEVTKKEIRAFVEGRVNDRIGLVVFGEEALIQCPTTVDYGVLINTLKAVEIGMAGDGTAIGSAIGEATLRLKDLPGHSKVLILLTDGENTTGILDPVEAARAAATYGIRIYTIGVGTQGKAPFLVQGLFGGKQFQYREVRLDEVTLKAVADATGGKYFRADSAEKLGQIYKLIDQLEKTEVEVKEFVDYEELYLAALLPALLLLLVEFVLRATWMRTLP
jgi:Ca-activated chloride channel family protein